MAQRFRREYSLLALFFAKLARQCFRKQSGRKTLGMFGKPEDGFVKEIEKRTAQHAQQAHFVAGAFQRTEQIHQVEDFLLGVKGVSAHKIIIDAIAAQCLFVIRHVGQCAEEQGDIA